MEELKTIIKKIIVIVLIASAFESFVFILIINNSANKIETTETIVKKLPSDAKNIVNYGNGWYSFQLYEKAYLRSPEGGVVVVNKNTNDLTGFYW
jgi:hypothetical protein